MSGPRPINVYGHRLAPLARIADVGEAVGLSRSTAYRAAADWPLTGPATSRRVCVSRLLDSLGIPYTVETEGASDGEE